MELRLHLLDTFMARGSDGGTYKVDFAAVAEKLVDEELARAGA